MKSVIHEREETRLQSFPSEEKEPEEEKEEEDSNSFWSGSRNVGSSRLEKLQSQFQETLS